MSRLQCSAKPLLVFFFFGFVLFVSFMWFPDLLDHSIKSNKVETDSHTIRTRVDTAVVSTIRSRYREAGKVKKFGGVKSYIAGSLHSKRGILVASDVFGFAKPNLRRLVDKIAAAGYYVVAPDFFNGDPWVEYSKRGFQDWLNHHLAVNGVEVAKPVLEAFKRKGISTIGIAGFCWGAKLTTILAARDDIKAVVTPHPTYVTVDDIKNVRAPISILGGGNDSITPAATIKQFAEVLATKPQVPSFVKIFPGYPHGWTLLYNVTDRPAVKAANKGHKYILAWFNKYLKY